MGQTDGLLLGFADYAEAAQRLAAAAGLRYAQVDVHRFPDGESLVRLPLPLPERVVFCRSLDHPNSKLVELELAADTARAHGVRHLTLVAPYLAYMRQDKAFAPGEAVSQQIVGRMLARCFDALVTVDPHLHRVHRLGDAVPVKQAVCLSAAGLLAAFLGRFGSRHLLLGPDEESAQWVEAIAAGQGLEYVVASKERSGDREVRITLPESDYRGRDILLVDDVASTGHTLEAVARQLQPHRPASVSVLVTHALFVGDAEQRVRASGVEHIYSTDSIPHATNRVQLAGLLAGALRNESHFP